MPELPDIALYLEALDSRVAGQPIERLRIANPFVVRTIAPAPSELAGRPRPGLATDGEADRLRSRGRTLHRGAPDDRGPAALARGWAPRFPARSDWRHSTFRRARVIFTEAGSKRQASIHLVRGEAALAALDPQGLEVLTPDLPDLCGPPAAGESHVQARADRSAHLQRDRERVLRRDPARGPAVADEDGRVTVRRRDRAVFDATRDDAADVDRPAARGGRWSSSPRR